HERETEGEHKEDQNQKQFALAPEDDETPINGDLVLKQPQLGHGGEWQKDAGDKEPDCRQQHQHDRPAGPPVYGNQWGVRFHERAPVHSLSTCYTLGSTKQDQSSTPMIQRIAPNV